MSLNLEAKDSYHVFDEFGMLIIPSDELSWKDSLGRTVLAWIAYGKPEELKEAVNDCFNDKTWRLYRHPEYTKPASRDHYSYLIILQKLTDSSYGFNTTIDCLPRMRGMNLWMKSLAGIEVRLLPKWLSMILYVIIGGAGWISLITLSLEAYEARLWIWMSSFITFFVGTIGLINLYVKAFNNAEFLYYLIYTPGALIGNIWLRICRCVGRIGPEKDNEWWIDRFSEYISPNVTNGNIMLHERTKWQKLWGRVISISIPAYALHNKAWQIYVMPDSKRKERLKRILLKRVGKSNIMLRLLFEPKVIYNAEYLKGSYKLVTQQEVGNYPHMAGYRSGAYLNTTKRTIRELTEEEAKWNTYEKDLIKKLYNETTIRKT